MIKNQLAFLLLCTIFFSCKKQVVIDNLSPGLIENQTFNSTVLIDGHTYDGTTIQNCIFENINGDGLQIRDVNNLCIDNCIFRDISEDAIRFRNSGISDSVKISNNQIYNIEENGILAAENHTNTLITGNTIYNVATSSTSSLAGAPHHGIYFQGFNVKIIENTIYDIINPDGNCISIRTYGTIAKNTLHGATDHGISYFSDHPGNGNLLLIENNFIYDNGKRGINLSSNGQLENHISSAKIRFNTIISATQSPLAMTTGLSGVTFELIGNVVIRTDGSSTFVFTDYDYLAENNYTGFGDIGFVDFVGRDLHLGTISIAENYATGTTDFPADDIDGELRTADNLDAGADER